MKTSELIDLLEKDVSGVAPGVISRRLGGAILGGGALTLAVVAFILKLQPLVAVAALPGFWVKLLYTAALAAVGVVAVRRLATPGERTGAPLWTALGVLALMALLGLGELAAAPPAQRLAIWVGHTWRVCSPLILTLALPIYVALTIAVRSLAPTRLTLAGAGCGFAAGAIAATLYGLHCPEQAPAFVVTWYSLGIVAATGLGAATGRWLLKW